MVKIGSGAWSGHTYAASTATKVASGTSFGYSASVARSGLRAAHTALDPVKLVAGPASPFAGKNIRESRDSDEHPLSVPIAIAMDVTGSMGIVPVELQKNLATLFGLLQVKGYVADPQILVGAYGDAYTDSVPLQASAFESDNRIDDALDNLFLEGGGGGNGGETASLFWYFIGTHTDTDAKFKRGKKGYLITIGDECTLGLTKRQIKQFTGDDVEADLSPEDIVKIASNGWDIYHLVIDNWSAKVQDSIRKYTALLGDHCIVLEDPAAAAETIAGIIGFHEGAIDDLDEFGDDLKDVGSLHGAAATKALAKLGAAGAGGGAIVASSAPAGLGGPNDSTTRL